MGTIYNVPATLLYPWALKWVKVREDIKFIRYEWVYEFKAGFKNIVIELLYTYAATATNFILYNV
jgi:hypothetical protein